MQQVGYLLGAVAAFVAFFLIASPERFFRRQIKKKKTVGPSYWGNYHDNENTDDQYQCIESVVYSNKDQAIVGSETYARGWGVKE